MEIYTGQPGLIRRGKKQIIKKLHYIKEPKEPILANASTMLEASKFLHQQPQEMPSLAKARQRRHKSHCLSSLKTCTLSRGGGANQLSISKTHPPAQCANMHILSTHTFSTRHQNPQNIANRPPYGGKTNTASPLGFMPCTK